MTRESEMYGSSRHSRILTPGQRREMGWYEEPWLPGLPGISIRIFIKFFHIDGMEAV
jgi:hypothetical protein